MVPWAVLLADSSGAVFGMLCVVGQIAGACVGFWLIYKAHTWREPEPKKERPNNEKWS
jgi:membrane protein YqaA with SNARE-associated domain